MKNLITIFTTLFFICMTYANDFIYTYTIKYDNTQDVLIKIKIPLQNGIYFLKVVSNENQYYKKLIKE